MRRLGPSTLALALALALAPLSAAPVAAQPSGERLETRIQIFGMAFDNFFQAPDGAPQEDVDAARAKADLTYRLAPDSPLALFGSAAYTMYGQDLDDSPAIELGLRRDGEVHEWTTGLSWQADQPVFDVGDELERADTLGLTGEYAYRIDSAWEIGALAEWEQQEFELTPRKDNDRWGAGASVRYRGWGYVLSPEVGFETGARAVDDPTEDYDQQDLWVKLRSAPIRPLYLSLRYRLRERDYTTGSPTAANFGREDERDQWTLAADYRLTRRLVLNLYADYLDADSTKDSRVFTTTLIGLGVTFEL